MGFAETKADSCAMRCRQGQAVLRSQGRERRQDQDLALPELRAAQVTRDMYQSAPACLPGRTEPQVLNP